MLRNGRELLVPGYMDWDAWSERDVDIGLEEELVGDVCIVATFTSGCQ